MKYALALVFGISMIATANAGQMADDEAMASAQTKVDDEGKSTSTECGGTITGKFDRASFKGDDATGIAGYCVDAVDGVKLACQSMPAQKKNISKMFKSVTCHYDEKVTDNHAVKVTKKGTNIDVAFNKNSANIGQTVSKFVQDQ
jgi:hypothetical protein